LGAAGGGRGDRGTPLMPRGTTKRQHCKLDLSLLWIASCRSKSSPRQSHRQFATFSTGPM